MAPGRPVSGGDRVAQGPDAPSADHDRDAAWDGTRSSALAAHASLCFSSPPAIPIRIGSGDRQSHRSPVVGGSAAAMLGRRRSLVAEACLVVLPHDAPQKPLIAHRAPRSEEIMMPSYTSGQLVWDTTGAKAPGWIL